MRRRALFLISLLAPTLFLSAASGQEPRPSSSGVRAPDSCLDCHREGRAAREHLASVHARFGVRCSDCHGGDPTKSRREEAESPQAGFKGKISPFDIPKLCDTCHGKAELIRRSRTRLNPFAEYQMGVHGNSFFGKENEKAPQCGTCHEVHRVLSSTDPESPTHPSNVNRTCGKCHGEADIISEFDISSEIPAEVARGVHGPKGPWTPDQNLPTCASCHGPHWNFAPRKLEVFEVCGRCHSLERALFVPGHPHFRPEVPCSKCHGAHEIRPPTPALFTDPKVCLACHKVEAEPEAPASRYLRELLQALRPVEVSLKGAEEELGRMKRLEFSPAREEEALRRARQALLTEFGRLQHSLDMNLVLPALASAREQALTAESLAMGRAREIGRARLTLFGGALYLMALAALLVGLRRTRHRNPRRDTGPSDETVQRD